jgi:hypothetical protein
VGDRETEERRDRRAGRGREGREYRILIYPQALPTELSAIPVALQDTPEYKELMELLKAQQPDKAANERVIPSEALVHTAHQGYKVMREEET